MLKRLILFLPLLLLAACEHPGPPMPAEPNFTRYQPIYLDVATMDMNEVYQSPMKSPYVEHLIPFSPADAMKAWIRDRLRAAGTDDKSIEIIINDASVKATPLQGGGMFPSLNNANRYDARLDVEMRIYGSSDAMSLASIHVTATRSVSIADKASLDERRAIFDKMIFDLMQSMNAELEKNIYQYFGNYINYSHGV